MMAASSELWQYVIAVAEEAALEGIVEKLILYDLDGRKQ